MCTCSQVPLDNRHQVASLVARAVGDCDLGTQLSHLLSLIYPFLPSGSLSLRGAWEFVVLSVQMWGWFLRPHHLLGFDIAIITFLISK